MDVSEEHQTRRKSKTYIQILILVGVCLKVHNIHSNGYVGVEYQKLKGRFKGFFDALYCNFKLRQLLEVLSELWVYVVSAGKVSP